jgi:hypothetical protein
MSTAQTDLSDIIRGDTFTLSLLMLDKLTQVPIDVSGRQVTLTLKTSTGLSDADASAQGTETLPNDANSQNGVIVVSLSADATKLLQGSTRYVYDVELRDGSSVLTLMLGRVRVIADVTRGS